jgi:hypothetical protein
MARISTLLPVLVFGLVSGCAAIDASPDPTAENTSAASIAPAATSSCVQITRPRVEYWSEFPPEPGEPAPREYYKTCITQSDCSSICEGFDVVPSVYSWHLTIRCTRCT